MVGGELRTGAGGWGGGSERDWGCVFLSINTSP